MHAVSLSHVGLSDWLTLGEAGGPEEKKTQGGMVQEWKPGQTVERS